MLTDYKYRKARKMVKAAKISNGGKNIFYCALRQYKKNLIPTYGIFQEEYGNRKQACIVGAAIADKMQFGITPTDTDDNPIWEETAVKEFGVKKSAVYNIESGFDAEERTEVKNSNYARLAYDLSELFGLKDE